MYMLFVGKHGIRDFFYRIGQALLSYPTVDIHRHFRCCVTRQVLGFLDAARALNDEIDIGHAAGMKVELAFGGVLWNVGGFEIDV